jgi:O-antigen/teichoic acid export membrane protein
MPDVTAKPARILRHAAWMIFGGGVPLLLAVVAIPNLLRILGGERFGILVLAWTVMGYFSLLDFGLGRALTRFIVSERLDANLEVLARATWTTVFVLFAAGAIVAAACLPVIPWLTSGFLEMSLSAQAEATTTFKLIAVSIPFVTASAPLVGFLEAHKRFGVIGAVRLVTGCLNYAAPLAIALVSDSLIAVIAAIVVVRILLAGGLLAACAHTAPGIARRWAIEPAALKPMLSFGAWLTASSIAAPIIIYMDRFVAGGIVTVAMLAYYVTPQEIVTRLSIIPGAFASIFFPRFVAALSADAAVAPRILARGLVGVFLVMVPPTLVFAVFSSELLTAWMGAEFASHAALVLTWLSAGILLNAGAQVLSAFIHSAGRADITAKLYVVEMPLYLICLLWLVPAHGIVGVAYAWFARIAFDGIALLLACGALCPSIGSLFVPALLVTSLTTAGLVAGSMLPMTALKLAAALAIIAVLAGVSWYFLLAEEDRDVGRRLLARARLVTRRGV